MTQETALKLALEYIEAVPDDRYNAEHIDRDALITAIEEALAQPEQEPVHHAVIAGALFDFMGWLTSRKVRIVLSSADEASPAVEAITEFAKMRNLSLDDAKVQDWNTTPPQRTWVGLSEDELERLIHNFGNDPHTLLDEVDARLRSRNT